MEHAPVLSHLDGGHKCSRDVRTEAGRHGELGDIFLLLHCCGDALLAEELQVGHAVLHPHHVERRATRQEQTGVPVTPTQRGDGALQGDAGDALKMVLPHLLDSALHSSNIFYITLHVI